MATYNLDAAEFTGVSYGRRYANLDQLVGADGHTVNAVQSLTIVGSTQVPFRGWIIEGIYVECSDDCAFDIRVGPIAGPPGSPNPPIFTKAAGDGFLGDVLLSGVGFSDGQRIIITQTAGTFSNWAVDVRVDA